MSKFEEEIFKGKKFSDLLGEIYDNQRKKEKQIRALLEQLKPLIVDISDATLIVPLIKEYMELSIKNDEALIKMATIVQRSLNNSTSEADASISDEEKKQLLQEYNKFIGDKK